MSKTPKPHDLPSLEYDTPLFAAAGEPFTDWDDTDCTLTHDEWLDLEADGRYTPTDDAYDDLLAAALCDPTA